MCCKEITQAPVAYAIMQAPEDKRMQALFLSIYTLFYHSFQSWILFKFGSRCRSKDKLYEDAKDAFENGLIILYEKSIQDGLVLNGNLKTAVYSFGLNQLLAYYKKDRLDSLDLIAEIADDGLIEKENRAFLDERENDLMLALNQLPKKHRQVLVLKFYNELSAKQIANKLHVTPGHVDNISAKAYKKIREILKTKYRF